MTFLTQVVALAIQQRANPHDESLRWWLLGSGFWALGVVLMPLVVVPRLALLVRLTNPFVVLGAVFIYVGLCRFLGQPDHRWPLAAIVLFAIAAYGYWIDVHNDLSARTAVITATLAALTLLSAAKLLRQPDPRLRSSAHFTALAFAAYGGLSAVRVGVLFASPPATAYNDVSLMLPLAFGTPLVASLLWTFGFLSLVNQRLNITLTESTDRLQRIFNTIPDAALIARVADGRLVDVNAGFLAMSGHTRADVIGRSTLEIGLWHQPADRERLVAELRAHGHASDFEADFQRKDGSQWTGQVSSTVLLIDDELHSVGLIRDITEHKGHEAALQESEALYRSIINASPDDITITDLEGRILVTSPVASSRLGYDPADQSLVGTPLLSHLAPEDRARAHGNMLRLFTGNYSGPNEYQVVRRDETRIAVEVNGALIRNAQQQPTKMVFVTRDISERKRSEQHIERLMHQLEAEKRTAQLNANTDSLTGLANRRFFDAALAAAFRSAQRLDQPLSLVMLDVDHFKKFNDLYGHLAGDDCLRQIGGALRAVGGRATDLLARYGGEEFVALLPETEQAGALALAERLRLAVAALGVAHAASDTAPCVTISVGVVTAWPAVVTSPAEIIALADEALYTAKREGRNRTAVAAPEPQDTVVA
jgi:diguanylate cyclase (GGDEF)-like protein/PAS domain S-box-containing protein